MNTKQIIENIEKEFDERFHEIYAKETKKHIGGGEFYVNYIVDKNDEIKDFIRSYTRTLLEAFGREIIGQAGKNYMEWREYVNKQYEDISFEDIIEDRRPKVILDYPEWLEENQNLKVKEIINQIEK